MNEKIKKRVNGSISIFLALIMLPMFTCAGLVVDGARISAARTSVSGAGDLAMNAALSEYDQILYDVYGLFAISKNMEELESNVSRYFSNSINNSELLDDSDSYTREFINSIFSMFSGDELEFSNIVDLDTTNKFSLTGVKDSSIANPSVLERQIVDYMKYRAPLNLTQGLLTKLGCIGETSKQTKAVEAKVDYDKKLDTVQDACETAYKAINAYNTKINDSNFSHSSYTSEINQSIINAKNDYNKMTQYLVALNSPSLKATAVSEDSTLKKDINDGYNNSSSATKNLDVLSTIKEKLKPYIELVDKNGSLEYVATDFMKKADALDSISGDNTFDGQIKYILQYNKLTEAKTVYTLLNLYRNYYNKLSESEKATFKKEYDKFEESRTGLLAASSLAQTKKNDWKTKVNSYGKDAGVQLYQTWYSSISGITDTLDDAIEALDAVIKKVKELDNARKTWGNKVSDLSDSDIKTSMKGDYENSAKDINEDAINKLKNILSNNKKHFEAIKERLDGIIFYGQKVCCSDYDSADFVGRFSSKIGNINVSSVSDITSNANSIISNNYSNKDANNLNPASFNKITASGEGMQFYKYLEKVCASADAADNDGAKKEATSNKKALIEKGNSSSNTTAAGLGGDIPASISEAIPAEVQTALDQLYSSEGSTDTFTPEAVDKDGSDSAAADKNKGNLTKISNLLDSLSKIAEAGRDKLYIEEYLTEMFSCYTDTISKDGAVSAMSLNNKDMSKNKFFGSEIEYILWGNNSVQTNLNNSKAMIFGIRFALNSIYAFTCTDTRTPALTAATAIAGWTGFGVPIVQTVILLAWSMAESYYDVDFLCQGKAVALYKTKETWFLGYGGLKSFLVDKAEEVTYKVIDDVFEKVEGAAVDATGNLVDSVQNSINTYSNDTLKGIYESIQGAISIPIEQLALQIVGSSTALSETDIVNKVKTTLSDLKSSGNGLVNECVNMAIDSLLNSEVSNIASKLSDMYKMSQDANSTISGINNLLYGDDGESGLIGDLKIKIQYIVVSKVEEYGTKFKNSVAAKITEGGNKVKENIKDQISDFAAGISGGSASTKGNTSVATGFTMTYKEYLKTFIIIHMLISDDNKDAMLKRTAELIQANVSGQPNNNKFNIASSYTMVQISATISVRTTFFNIPIESGIDNSGKSTYSLDYSNIGTGRQKIKYTSILGY